MKRIIIYLAIIFNLLSCSQDDSKDTEDIEIKDEKQLDEKRRKNAEKLGWTWQDIDGNVCRNGSKTGIAYHNGEDPSKTLVFFQGGGACYNLSTCLTNLRSFSGSDFYKLLDRATGQELGILNIDEDKNPFGKWNIIYVPYCTGDVHIGDKIDPKGKGSVLAQEFKGYQNSKNILNSIDTLFPETQTITLAGISAGGYGVIGNYLQAVEIHPDKVIHLVADSSPIYSFTYMDQCLHDLWVEKWGLDLTFKDYCGAYCSGENPNLLLGSLKKILSSLKGNFLLISSSHDKTIRYFNGFSYEKCEGYSLQPADTFEKGLLEMRDLMLETDNENGYKVSTYLVESCEPDKSKPCDQHVWILGDDFYNFKSNDLYVYEAVANVLSNKSIHIGYKQKN